MKRLNPKTNLPYKRGFQREDGKLFIQYLTKNVDADGYYLLKWGDKSWIERSNKNSLEWQKNNKEICNKRNNQQRFSNRGRALALLLAAKKRAKKKNLEFNLTKLWVLQKLDNGVCELSGIKFDLSSPNGTAFNPYSPSIDKIDSKKGYTFDNCRVIITALNIALSEYGLTTYLEIAEKVISKQKT